MNFRICPLKVVTDAAKTTKWWKILHPLPLLIVGNIHGKINDNFSV
jgi:hypothetical protein